MYLHFLSNELFLPVKKKKNILFCMIILTSEMHNLNEKNVLFNGSLEEIWNMTFVSIFLFKWYVIYIYIYFPYTLWWHFNEMNISREIYKKRALRLTFIDPIIACQFLICFHKYPSHYICVGSLSISFFLFGKNNLKA